MNTSARTLRQPVNNWFETKPSLIGGIVSRQHIFFTLDIYWRFRNLSRTCFTTWQTNLVSYSTKLKTRKRKISLPRLAQFIGSIHEDLLHTLKQMVVQSNVVHLTTKLCESMRCRREIIAKDLGTYLAACDFYFSAPRLVSKSGLGLSTSFKALPIMTFDLL